MLWTRCVCSRKDPFVGDQPCASDELIVFNGEHCHPRPFATLDSLAADNQNCNGSSSVCFTIVVRRWLFWKWGSNETSLTNARIPSASLKVRIERDVVGGCMPIGDATVKLFTLASLKVRIERGIAGERLSIIVATVKLFTSASLKLRIARGVVGGRLKTTTVTLFTLK